MPFPKIQGTLEGEQIQGILQIMISFLNRLTLRLPIRSPGFPCSSAGKESACNAGDPGLIPGSRKIPWRKNRLPISVCMGFPGGSDSKESACNTGDLGTILGWEDPLEEHIAIHSSILAWRISMDRGAWWATVHGVAKSRT